MTPNDPRLQNALDAATDRIRSTLTAVVVQLGDRFGAMARSSTRIAERDALNTAQFELRRHAGTLHRDFERALVDRIAQDLAPPPVVKKAPGAVDWQSLALVDDREVENRMSADRLGQQIAQGAEEALRELDAHIGALLPRNAAQQGDRNPLRGEVLGAALHSGIAAVSKDVEVRRLLTRELGAAMAKAMPACYQAILDDLQRRGVQPLELSVRQIDGPGYQLPGLNSGYESVDSLRGASSTAEPVVAPDAHAPGPFAGYRAPFSDFAPPTERFSRPGSRFERTQRSDSSRGGAYLSTAGRAGAANTVREGAWRHDSAGSGGSARDAGASRRGDAVGPIRSDAELMALLRQLNAAGAGAQRFDAGVSQRSDPGVSQHPDDIDSLGARPLRRSAAADAYGEGFAADGGASPSGRGMSGLMAVNLIRTHRDELVRAAGGHLDHMVIDVVGSLFDQILSDPRVPPQMARQIARLQLPVLRVALSDSTFFSSRRHPVRRFVNRIASLACAFDEFDEGPGRHFLERVKALVDEIVNGDFDQIELYAAKLEALERHTEEDARQDAQRHGAVATLGAKETELRLQQRYVLQLHAALAPLGLPAYLEAFLSQVWSQALLLAVLRDGPDADRARRYRRAARDLATSVQPQGLPMLRKRFLLMLPPLFKDLDEGLTLIGWPADAKTAFMTRLRAAQAQSLKLAPRSELDHNLYAKQFEQVFAAPLPGQEALSPADPVPEVEPESLAKRFTPEEAQRIGLVSEAAVDWSETLAVDAPRPPGDGTTATPDARATEPGAVDVDVDVDIDIDLGDPAGSASGSAEGREPTRGPALMEHVRLGFAYQMHLKDGWQKVRLAHVSPGRGFFVFTGGRRHQETISMTARMLARMCETQRFRAVETDYLVDRASHRARKQLASLRAGPPPPAAAAAAASRPATPGP